MENFQAFFSYSHHDARTNKSTVETLTTKLENNVNAKLINAKFRIWKDTENLRTGDRWNDRIGDAIKQSNIFIILLTPKWIESEYCRKEFNLFSELEPDLGEYVAPIMARNIDRQAGNFTQDQSRIFGQIRQRQYTLLPSANLSSVRTSEKEALINKISDDIEGMIERLRNQEVKEFIGSHSVKRTSRVPRPEYTSDAHNYKDVDFLSVADIVVDQTVHDGKKNIHAHIDFLPRLYIQTSSARLEFGVKRAFLSINDQGKFGIAYNEDWLGRADRQSAYYVNMKDDAGSLTICMDPPSGQTHLAELALPVAAGENRYSKVATVNSDANFTNITAKIVVSLKAESIYVFSSETKDRPATVSLRKVTAIINAMIAKDGDPASERVERIIEVKERKS